MVKPKAEQTKRANNPDRASLASKANASETASSPSKAMLNDYPEVATQWHPTLNRGLDLSAITAKSHKKVWWKCAAGPDHEWIAPVANRTSGRGCPFCSGRAVTRSNSLAVLYPEIASEWHPQKNGQLTPYDISPGSSVKIWWQCKKFSDHVWDAPTKARVKGGGCSFCSGKRVSVSNSLATKYPELAAEWHASRNGSLTPQDVVAGGAKRYWWQCQKFSDHSWSATIHNRIKGSGCGVCRGFKAAASNSLGTLFPHLASQWHPTKNGDLKPDDVVSGSNKKYWWKCSQGDDHEWHESPVNRTSKDYGCPMCSGKKVTPSTSLAVRFPDIAREWHPEKNGKLTPFDVTPSSNQLIWWKCSEVNFHSWQSPPNRRTRKGREAGCPGCNTGWTIEVIRGFVESIKSHLTTFSPAELYILFQQNGLLDTKGKGKSFVDALATGRFPSEQIEKFVNGTPSLVDSFVANAGLSLENLELRGDEDSSLPLLGDTNLVVSEPDNELPSLTVPDVLSSLDSEVVTSADEEAIEFLLSSAKAKLWQCAYRNQSEALQQAESHRGGRFAEQVREEFLNELQNAVQLPIPDGYSFKVNGEITLPNLMQRHAASSVLSKRRVGNWSGTGAGKTLSAIYSSRLADASLTVICCPNSVVDGWKRAILSIFKDSDVQTKSWNPAWRDKSKYRYLVLNYEIFQQVNTGNNVKSFIGSSKVDFLVVDEIHYAKQRTVENISLRRQMVSLLSFLAAKDNPNFRILGMSATPVINNLQEGLSLIELITGFVHSDLEVDKPSVPNCMKMHQRLVTLGIRWMPEYKVDYEERKIDVDCSTFIDEIQALGASANPLELEKILTRARLPSILKEIRPKTLIYTHYVTGIDALLYDAISQDGWKVGFYTGEDKSGLEGFLNGDVDVLIGSSSIGTGVDGLQNICNRLIVNVLPWTAAEFEQLKGRIYRQGQAADKVDLIIPVTFSEVNGTRWSWCDSKLQRLQFKKSIADAVVDGVVPEGHLRTPAQAYKDTIAWLERLKSGQLQTLTRRPIVIAFDDIADYEQAKRVGKFGDFSELNRRWNISKSSSTFERLTKNPEEWEHYHSLYQEARKHWTSVPFEDFISWAEKRDGYCIGDFGCGEAIVAKRLSGRHQVYSFDHVAIDDSVVACDMCHVPLDDESLDVALFSLSLMGANVSDYINEAYRVLKLDGHLHIWEATSRFKDLDGFVKILKDFGFNFFEKNIGKFTHLHLLKGDHQLDGRGDIKF